MYTTLKRTLKRRGWDVVVAETGRAALSLWNSVKPGVVLLDLTLPDIDGLNVLEQARKSGLKTPVAIITARGTVGDKIIGLNTGADDYLPKPFDLDELEARLYALLRRSPAESEASAAPNPKLQGFDLSSSPGRLQIDPHSGAIHLDNRVFELPPREASMLRCLIERRGKAIAKEQLFNQVFSDDTEVLPEAVEVVAYRLRKRLVNTGIELVTLRGLGYLLRET